MKEIFLLGASGSIGRQTLDVIDLYPQKFKLKGFSVGYQTEIIDEILSSHEVETCYMILEDVARSYQEKYPNVQFFSGTSGLIDALENTTCNWVVSSLSGFAGFDVTIRAIELKKNIALANKEILVAGGKFVMDLVKENNVLLTPIDSEHSALFQAMSNHETSEVDSVVITASGGSFRHLTRDELQDVTLKDALKHPNWSMGQKITIDSATMMNKAFEVLEAHYLYNLSFDQIKVLVSPNSIVHGLVIFKDTSIISQWATSDMRLPILYALSDQEHLSLPIEPLDLSKGLTIDLKPLDVERYPVFKAALRLMKLGGDAGCVMNAINEVAVQLFLKEKISFLQCENMIIELCNQYEPVEITDIQELWESNKKGEAMALSYVKEHYGF